MSILKIKNITVGEGTPKIIVPLVGTTEEEILQAAERKGTLAGCD